MSAKGIVTTQFTCDRCGREETLEGARADSPPIHWGGVQIADTQTRQGNSRTTTFTNSLLCPPCREDVTTYLAQPPDATR